MTEPSTTPDASDLEPPKDAEGLYKEYDVILCGTGLVQSILASALARAGKTILHVDGNDYYGEYDAVVPLDYEWEQQQQQQEEHHESIVNKNSILLHPKAKIRYLSSKTSTKVDLEIGTQITTPYGKGRILSLSPLQIQLERWILANETSPILYMDESALPTLIPTRQTQAEALLKERFALDLTASLLFASGAAVEGLLASNVAEYLEFKSVEGLLWSAEHTRVPCSKADVFATSLLSPLEKRKLMKFLQLTLDYATAKQAEEEASKATKEEGEATESKETPAPAIFPQTTPSGEEQVQFLNEMHLNQGRSLARPQNKAVSTKDLDNLQSSLDMEFTEYLTKQAKLSPKLSALVTHALALQNASGASTAQAMTRLCQHVQSLGRFGTTAFLIPMYGSGELSQAFCRSAAVHGGTYLLRRAPKRVLVDEEGCVSGIVLGGDDISDFGCCTEDKEICSKHVVVPNHALGADGESQGPHLMRRISVVQGRLLLEYAEQRHVLIIPPGDVCNANVIFGVVLDNSAQISPPGCSVLHLSTISDNSKDNSALERVMEHLKVHEMYHVAFSYPLSGESLEFPEGLHVCRPAGESLVIDDAFEQAKRIFDQICPGREFLHLSEEMNSAIEERLAGRQDEDDERMVLQSAAKMVSLDRESGATAEGDEPEIDAVEGGS